MMTRNVCKGYRVSGDVGDYKVKDESIFVPFKSFHLFLEAKLPNLNACCSQRVLDLRWKVIMNRNRFFSKIYSSEGGFSLLRTPHLQIQSD
jgi:hypothetical protein